jgi:methylated-DNA-[protein]-cysteine S-methyltransferase
MTQELFYSVFLTAAGWMGVLGSDLGLRRVILPQPSEAAVNQLLSISLEPATLSINHFLDLTERFLAYFSGCKVDFPDRLDLSGATSFQRQVWQAARIIPYGQTRSYAWVAAQSGNPGAARASGQALGKNILPIIIPCHRVVASNGGIGGFSAGMKMKRFLISLEGVKIGNC